MLTVKDVVLGRIRAMGPCGFKELLHESMDQATEIMTTDSFVHCEYVVKAINELCREGKIELYDTGDSWDVC